MGKVVNAVTIGKLIEAHLDNDEEKFLSYAKHIEDAYRENNDEISAKVIHSRFDGNRNDKAKITVGDKRSCSYTVGDALVRTEYCGNILDFCGEEIKVTEDNREEIYGLLVNQICASGNDILICTFLNEDKWLAKQEQKKKTLKELAEKFDGREYAWEQFTSEEIFLLRKLGVVVLYGASDDLCEIDGAIEGEVDCYIGGSEKVEFTLAKDGPVPFGKNSSNFNKVSVTQKNGCWKYHISGLINYSKFMIKECDEDYCEAVLFFAEDI